MAQDNPQRMFPRGAGIEHILALFDGQRFGTHQSGHIHPCQQADDHDDVIHAGLQVSIKHQQQEEGRDRHQDIHRAHHQVIQPAAEVAAQRADQGTDQRRKEHRQTADHERDLAAVKRAGKVVASVFVGAEPVGAIGRQRARPQRHLIRIVRTQPRAQGSNDKNKKYKQRELRRTIAAQLVTNLLPASAHPGLPQGTYAGIGEAIEQIGDQVTDDQHQRREHDDRHNQRVVEGGDRLDPQ